MAPSPKRSSGNAIVIAGDGQTAESGDQGIAIAGKDGTAKAGRDGVAIVRETGDAEIIQFGVAACLIRGGTAKGGHRVAAFVKDNGDAGTGDVVDIQDGLAINTEYRLNECREFVPVSTSGSV